MVVRLWRSRLEKQISLPIIAPAITADVTFEFILNIQGDVQRVERQHGVVDQTENGLSCHLWKHNQKKRIPSSAERKKKIHLLSPEQLHISLLKPLFNRKIHTSYMSCTLFLRFYIFACLCLYCCCSSVTCFWMSRLCKDSFTTLCTPPYKNTKVQVSFTTSL